LTAHATALDARPAAALFSRRVVFADHEAAATLVLEGGRIAAIERERALPGALDLGTDLLVPGLVELHTDHLEPHVQPRPKVHWNALSAVFAYDAQVASAGMTTVFDCLRAGMEASGRPVIEELLELGGALATAKETGLLRAEHHTHLRCEITSEDVLAEAKLVLDRFDVRILSLMDHTPGARQFRDVARLRDYYKGKRRWNDADLDVFFAERHRLHAANHDRHRAALVALAKGAGVALASHDDTTLEHVAESVADGVAIAEFPTTLEAARASHEAGLKVMMGAPNVVRGGSHSGNVSARALAEAGVLDVLSSDYVPISLMEGAFLLADVPGIGGLPGAIRTVTKTPAEAVGLHDRGEIAVGKRADLVQVTLVDDRPIVRQVWREGARIA
jgi:alpha-D-ribose 1-methylphosphonate 5-triphosphate diphosphatase